MTRGWQMKPIERGCLVLGDLLLFSPYSLPFIAKQAKRWISSDSCHVLTISMHSSKHLVLITIPQHSYQYHPCPTWPVTLERVPFDVANIECTVNTVWLPVLILHGISVKSPTVISRFVNCSRHLANPDVPAPFERLYVLWHTSLCYLLGISWTQPPVDSL